MAPPITVREYARLTTATVPLSLDEATVPVSAFEWLCQESARLSQSGANLVQLDGSRWLRLDNYVGVIETPCGTRIEILPKHVDGLDEIDGGRRLLQKMLARCLKVPARETRPTSIHAIDAPVTEWVMAQFLERLDHLVNRGVRFDYHSLREQQRFLRGRLDLARQLRQHPGREHLFHIEHDVFDADRAENRLLRRALDSVCKLTRDARNWRLSNELAAFLSPISASADIVGDFRQWRDDRLMAHYRPVKPWCSLILNEQSPLSTIGEWHGISLLFPMEKLFERYVEICLRSALQANATLQAQASSQHLCAHLGEKWFLMKPDFLVSQGLRRWVLDTKWKRLDMKLWDATKKYGLSQADFYQLFAYGKHYLDGRGDLFLVYPKTADFNRPLPPFAFSDDMRLWVVPFDLSAGALEVDAQHLSSLPLVRVGREALAVA